MKKKSIFLSPREFSFTTPLDLVRSSIKVEEKCSDNETGRHVFEKIRPVHSYQGPPHIVTSSLCRNLQDSPRGRTPLWWWDSPGWRGTPGGSWAACPPSSGSSPAAEGRPSDWTPAAGSACPCPWRRKSGSGTERPWAPRHGTSSSPPRRRFGWTRLGEKGEEISLADWERSEISEKVKKKKKKKKSWRSREEVWLTWCVALSLYLGTEGDRAWSTEPAAQRFLLCTSLRGLKHTSICSNSETQITFPHAALAPCFF